LCGLTKFELVINLKTTKAFGRHCRQTLRAWPMKRLNDVAYWSILLQKSVEIGDEA
jgi:hypothetical protein